MTDSYQFTNTWFDTAAKQAWDDLIPKLNPQKILEIGSYEGRSTCYLIDKLSPHFPVELHCIDSWHGGIEHTASGTDMNAVELRFAQNTKIALNNAAHPVSLNIHRGQSVDCLAQLLIENKRNYFDFIYIDGSHQAPDVLCDAVLSFKLLKVSGVIAFDDYLWHEKLPGGKDLLRCPKPAIDAFVNINFKNINVLQAPLYQLYIRKISD
jgi:predicted O-methyltransferase YrrM